MPTATDFLTTARLGFRTWRAADVDLAMELWGDPAVARYLYADGPPPRIAVVDRLAREIATEEEHRFQYWPVFRLDDGAHEAGVAVMDYTFGKLGARALFAGHHPENAASGVMLRRLGFRYTHDEFYAPTGLHHPSYLHTREEVAGTAPGSHSEE